MRSGTSQGLEKEAGELTTWQQTVKRDLLIFLK